MCRDVSTRAPRTPPGQARPAMANTSATPGACPARGSRHQRRHNLCSGVFLPMAKQMQQRAGERERDRDREM